MKDFVRGLKKFLYIMVELNEFITCSKNYFGQIKCTFLWLLVFKYFRLSLVLSLFFLLNVNSNLKFN